VGGWGSNLALTVLLNDAVRRGGKDGGLLFLRLDPLLLENLAVLLLPLSATNTAVTS
jgi:hypothetical protein